MTSFVFPELTGIICSTFLISAVPISVLGITNVIMLGRKKKTNGVLTQKQQQKTQDVSFKNLSMLNTRSSQRSQKLMQ
jgi:hypothetical protein